MRPNEFLSIFAALERAEVKYLVVGGVAVVLHGYLRATLDLDLIVQLEENNASQAMVALSDLGYVPKAPVDIISFANAKIRDEWTRGKNMIVFSLWNPKNPKSLVDIFVKEPLPFTEAYKRRVSALVDGTKIPIASIDDIITLKMQANRAKDRIDIEALRKIQDIEQKKS